MFDRFGTAAHGVRWALQQVKDAKETNNEVRVRNRRLALKPLDSLEGDAYRIRASQRSVTVNANTATGAIGGLLELARQSENGRVEDTLQRLKFQTRYYKQEVRFDTRMKHTEKPVYRQRRITLYTDDFRETFCQELARRHFNALVFYCGYHPFESFFDYEDFPAAAGLPVDVRARNREALGKLIETAARYGLQTFLHHYVSHFPAALHRNLKLKTGGRMANIEHPVIEDYNRYIYRHIFELFPDLTGLFMNFESTGDTAPFLDRTLVRECNAMRRKPVLVYRLWGISEVEWMAWLLSRYRGENRLVHKGHDMCDIYYYPVADDRVRIWKKRLPEINFAHSLGPCHNCGTNISSKLWTDPEYIHTLLRSMESKGTDSISFQSVFEQLLPQLPDTKGFHPDDIRAARANSGHLDAVVDYVRGEKRSEKAWARRYARDFGVEEKAGKALRDAIFESSQIILKEYWQFAHAGGQEGYLYPGRHSHYQEPFFYYPMSFNNHLGKVPVNISWRAGVVRDKPVRVVPEDTQAIIDYVNPAVKKKVRHNPGVLSRAIRGHIDRSQKAVAEYKRLAGKGADPWVLLQVKRNTDNGERMWREIEIGIELYSCYFAKSKAAFFRHIRKARQHMLDTVRVLGKGLRDTDAFCSTTASGPFIPDKDAEELERILRFEKEDIPFAALQAYMQSHERYNEIRRLCRPYAGMCDWMTKRNRGLLTQSLKAAERAVDLLASPKHRLYRDNVMAWVEYVRAELDWLTPPAMACPPDEDIGEGDGFRVMVHDQNYRWGERCWEAFSSFYRRQNFFREDHCDCRATWTKKGLKLSLREHGIDWTVREAAWEKNRGTVNQTGFFQAFIDTGRKDGGLIKYTFFFKGEGGTVSGGKAGPRTHLVEGCKTNFRNTNTNWRFDVLIPWDQLQRKPKVGDQWRLNILSNPSVIRNHRVVWCQAYEWLGDRRRLGTIVFTK